MYLFILESIGTSELILVGMIALIIFGPRKLPEMMRSFGKAMTEFKRSTNEFKESWEKEVSFDDLAKMEPSNLLEDKPENSIGRDTVDGDKEISPPEIKEIDQADIEVAFPGAIGELTDKQMGGENKPSEEASAEETAKAETTVKQDWL